MPIPPEALLGPLPAPAPIHVTATPEAEQAYRDAVWAAGEGRGPEFPNLDVLHGAMRISADFEADLATFRKRIQARHTLDAEVAELEAKAAQLNVDYRRAKAFGERPLTDFDLGTLLAEVREIHARLESLPPNATVQPLRLGSVCDLATALFLHETRYVEVLHLAAVRAREYADSARHNATEVLRQTFSAELRSEMERVHGLAGQLRERIAGREPIIHAERDVAICEARCNRLARGERVDSDRMDGVLPGSLGWRPAVPVKDLYYAERQKLNALRVLATPQARADADQANKRDLAEIGKLDAEFAELRKGIFEPRNMRWSD